MTKIATQKRYTITSKPVQPIIKRGVQVCGDATAAGQGHPERPTPPSRIDMDRQIERKKDRQIDR